MQKDESGQWHLDKRIPITLIILILLQTGGFVWFISKMDSRIVALETASIIQRDRDDRQDRAALDAATMIRGAATIQNITDADLVDTSRIDFSGWYMTEDA